MQLLAELGRVVRRLAWERRLIIIAMFTIGTIAALALPFVDDVPRAVAAAVAHFGFFVYPGAVSLELAWLAGSLRRQVPRALDRGLWRLGLLVLSCAAGAAGMLWMIAAQRLIFAARSLPWERLPLVAIFGAGLAGLVHLTAASQRHR